MMRCGLVHICCVIPKKIKSRRQFGFCAVPSLCPSGMCFTAIIFRIRLAFLIV